MTAVDHERVLLGLKEHILSKRSHGQRELLDVITRLEIDSRLPEAQVGFDDRPPVPAHLRLEEPHSAAHG
jgi:hypothetical protein